MSTHNLVMLVSGKIHVSELRISKILSPVPTLSKYFIRGEVDETRGNEQNYSQGLPYVTHSERRHFDR